MSARTAEQWLVGKPADVVAMARNRTFEVRAELAHAVIAGASGPTDWVSGGDFPVFQQAKAIAEHVGLDPDVLIEALLWDPLVGDACWGEAHERCCNEANELDTEAWYEALGQIMSDWTPKRPAWLGHVVWGKLRRKYLRATEENRTEVMRQIENDDDLTEECAEQGRLRHQAQCLRGNVGGDFHSMP